MSDKQTHSPHLRPYIARMTRTLLSQPEGGRDFQGLYEAVVAGHEAIVPAASKQRLMDAGLICGDGTVPESVRQVLIAATSEEQGVLRFDADKFITRERPVRPAVKSTLKGGAEADVEKTWYIVSQVEALLQSGGTAERAFDVMYQVASTGKPTREGMNNETRLELIRAGLMNSDATLADGVGDVVRAASEVDANGKVRFTAKPFVADVPRIAWSSNRKLVAMLDQNATQGKTGI